MIIPKDAIIAEEKIRDYLLKPQDKDDKSGFFGLAGYSREDYWELTRDIRNQLLLPLQNFKGSADTGIFTCTGAYCAGQMALC
ncbi:MAG TPA: hypothetical protein VG537_02960 [Candidatus Kapabacteria bacterium]|jgi:hypothetical protein|nr:hypothetical protein [Candidatus Kapabacteria bacterium]